MPANQDLEQILEEPISRRSFFRKSAAGLLLLEEAIRNSGCAPAFIAKPIVYPSNVSVPPIRSDYGAYSNMCGQERFSRHTGLDIAAERGYPVIAAADGKVIVAGWHSAGGNRVIIYHGADNDGKHIYTRYAHMDELNVKEGIETFEPVNRGQGIGTLGQTGSEAGSCGPHLHFELRVGNRPYTLIRYSGEGFSLNTGELSDPHDYWLREKNSPPDKIVIPPFIKGREYPAKLIRFTYPVPRR